VRYIALAFVALSVLGLDANAGQTARKPKTHTVVIEGTTFAPASLTIASGDSVVWAEQGSVSSHGDIEGWRLRLAGDCSGGVLEVRRSEEGRLRLHLHSSRHDEGSVAGEVVKE
jgi:hypothetical protein